MKTRDIVIAVVVLVLLTGAIFWRQRTSDNSDDLKVPETVASIEENLEDKFKIQIPDDAEKAELKDESGGGSTAVATRKFENNKFSSSFIADLPEPETGQFYEAWFVKGEEGADDYMVTSAGRLRSAKGGFLLDFTSNTDYSGYDKVIVTKETKADNTPEETVLEGNF